MGLKNKAKKSGAFRTLLKKLTEKDEDKKDEEKKDRSGFRNATKQLNTLAKSKRSKKLEKKSK